MANDFDHCRSETVDTVNDRGGAVASKQSFELAILRVLVSKSGSIFTYMFPPETTAENGPPAAAAGLKMIRVVPALSSVSTGTYNLDFLWACGAEAATNKRYVSIHETAKC